ncbi:aminodeoxychorismate synthase component I [Oceanobacillus kapialis]|uniref:aminodeoxychorismate synthase component I n=1 Tax=Oceanobacillus kapialis TaxID=481353 RepID=UPI003850754C
MHFTNPKEVITASVIEEVVPALKLVQKFVSQGYYAAGYVSYEAAPAFDDAFTVNSEPHLPFVWFGIFAQPSNEPITATGSFKTEKWTPLTQKHEYTERIQAIKEAIRKGITYQVNYTIRLLSQFSGDSIAYYHHLSKAQASNYSAYINDGKHTMISASPELFFHMRNNTILTKPMKGTAARGNTLQQDKQQKEWLANSAKNQAENVMIVDLLRNDLGRIAKAGTVKVPFLFQIESFPTVHQMTSTVTAELEEKTELPDVFAALFPCGSITGAPKGSTMNIIEGLEEQPRNVYCGAIGFITPQMEAIFNVPIRTVQIKNQTGKAVYGVGGGITWDSDPVEEYEEVLTKSKVLQTKQTHFQLLETIGYSDGNFMVLEYHLKRLKRSADYFEFQVNIQAIREELTNLEKRLTQQENWKIRLLLSRDGSTKLEYNPIKSPAQPMQIELAKGPIDNENIYLYHKTTNRSHYQSLFHDTDNNTEDILLWNDANEITEFTMGNIVVEMDGHYYTPPVESGLLPGTYRQALLEKGEIKERVIHKRDLSKCTNLWMINSVRGWVPVQVY